jgi:hypothetical protein
MDRLVALLNEYEKERKSWFTWRSIDSYDNCVYGVDCDWETEITMYSDLYSKQYWFIEWLVENDKIDFDKTQIWFQLTLWYWKYESLLMILSIQDNPLKYLCSILR